MENAVQNKVILPNQKPGIPWWNWFKPRSSDPEEAFRERTARIAVFVLILVAGTSFCVSQFVFHDPITTFSLPSVEFVVAMLSLMAGIAVVRRKLIIAGWLLVITALIGASGFTMIVAGIGSSYSTGLGTAAFVLATFLTALLLPISMIPIVVVVSVILVAVVAQAQIALGNTTILTQAGGGGLGGIVSSTAVYIALVAAILWALRSEFDARLARERQNAALAAKNAEIAALNAQLAADKAAEADKANNLKSEFLASMSHELRTPLNSIIGYTDIILNKMWPPQLGPDQIDKKRDELLNNVKTNGAKLLGLINDILDLAKIEAGQVEIHLSSASPRQLIEEVVVTGQGFIHKQKKDIFLKSTYADNLPASVQTDQKRLQQVITNLVSNAVKFTDVGGVTVAVELASKPEHYVIKVTDSGKGMPTDAKNYIFEKFRQVDGSDSREQQGTGLGLAITKNLVEMLGGTIDLDTEVGKGTTFYITLPIQPVIPQETHRHTLIWLYDEVQK